jgi:hypothetical protein
MAQRTLAAVRWSHHQHDDVSFAGNVGASFYERHVFH